VTRLRERFAGVYALVEVPGDDHGLPTVRHASAPAASAAIAAIPAIDPGLVAAYVLTSGSTASRFPTPSRGACSFATRVPSEPPGRRARPRRPRRRDRRRDGAGAAHVRLRVERPDRAARRRVLDAERPFFPADVAAALARAAAPRCW
jgi:hypothetical protein